MDFRWLSAQSTHTHTHTRVNYLIYKNHIWIMNCYVTHLLHIFISGKLARTSIRWRYGHFQIRNCYFECDRCHLLFCFFFIRFYSCCRLAISVLVTILQFVIILLKYLEQMICQTPNGQNVMCNYLRFFFLICIPFSSLCTMHSVLWQSYKTNRTIWHPKEVQMPNENWIFTVSFSYFIFIESTLNFLCPFFNICSVHTFHMSMIFATPLSF